MKSASPAQKSKTQGLFIRYADWRFAPVALLVVAVLYLPSFQVGDFLDDQWHASTVRGDDRFTDTRPWNMYTFGVPSPSRGEIARETGAYVWWTVDDFQARFFRPLPSLLLVIDHTYFPDYLKLIHSLLWYGLLLFGMGALYKTALPDFCADDLRLSGRIAFLAWFLFAIDDSHAVTVAWTSHRYAVISLAIGVWALWAHERYMRQKGPAWLGPPVFALALLGGEVALTLLGYLFLRSVKKPWRFLPYATVAAAYLLFYNLAGYGTRSMTTYINPSQTPLDFLQALILRWPVLAGAATGPVSANVWVLVETIPEIRIGLIVLGYAMVLGVILIVKPFRDFEGTWLFGGALLALIPVCATFPTDRLLLASGVGFFPVLARFLLERGRGIAFWFLAAVHLPLAMIALIGNQELLVYLNVNGVKRVAEVRTMFEREPKYLVSVNAPGYLMGIHFPAVYENETDGRLDYFRLLSMARRDIRLTRIDEHSLDMEAPFLTLENEFGMRTKEQTFAQGEQIRLPGMRITIRELRADGFPARIRFRFDRSIDRLPIIYWDYDRFRPLPALPIGETFEVPDAREDLYI